MRWPFTKRAANVSRETSQQHAEPVLVPKAPPPRRVTAEDIATIGAGAGNQKPLNLPAFRMPEPPPGMRREVSKIAMDAGIEGTWGWANGMSFAEGIGFFGYPYLSELTQRPEYRRPSEILAKQMTRKWIRLQTVGDDDKNDKADKLEALEAAMKRHDIQKLFARMVEHDGFFGRGQLFIDIDDSWRKGEAELKTPLIDQKIKRGAKLRFVAVEPLWSYPGYYTARDPMDPTFYKPQNWYVMARTVHATRLMTFVSREVPDLLKPAYAFGGLSLSQMAKPYIDNWLRTRQSVSDLVSAFSTMVYKTDMARVLQNGGMEALIAVVEQFKAFRDNRGVFVVDKSAEEMENIAVPLSGLSDLQAQSMEQMAAVTGIPIVVLLGITPKGLNNSSEPEIRTFYDWILSQQEHLLTPKLSRVLELLQLAEFGEVDPSIGFTWVPLWQLDEKTQADLRKVNADTAAVLIESGQITPHEAREALAAEPDAPYSSIALAPEADPEPPQAESDEAGGIGEQELRGAIRDESSAGEGDEALTNANGREAA
jgi:phage-related protein (TIGR01555 family)